MKVAPVLLRKDLGMVVAVAWMLVLSILLSQYQYPLSNTLRRFTEAMVLNQSIPKGKEDSSSQFVDAQKDELLDSIPSAGYNEQSCLSRYQSVIYRKASPHKPSSYLLSRLRKYEALHKRCGPCTESYNKTLKVLESDNNIEPIECNYIVWVPTCGLGNRILSLASTFLYALLTNRVLLVHRGVDMADLFCEPFPETSWLLTLDFPLAHLRSFDEKSSYSYGNMLKRKSMNGSIRSVQPFSYLHISNDYTKTDMVFFCDQNQKFLHKVPWLFMKSNMYFAPSLFLIPSFEQELNKLFLSTEIVFHYLGRYLFYPSNEVWGLITRYYDAYLANADERVGIQIRIFRNTSHPFPHVLDRIRACFLKEKLLPEVSLQEAIIPPLKSRKSKVVLVTSLISWYYENIMNMYWKNATVSGEVIKVYQPSSEQHQQSENNMHNKKAWAEMYLLSLSDVLVTSSRSTFGYVAQGLGGLKPWLLYNLKDQIPYDPPCRRAMSMEPCFHCPPTYGCNKTKMDSGLIVPHVKHCEDVKVGIKLVDRFHF